MSAPKTADVWAALTKAAMLLMKDLQSERERVEPAQIADSALDAFSDVAPAEVYRGRLIAFVQDMLGDR